MDESLPQPELTNRKPRYVSDPWPSDETEELPEELTEVVAQLVAAEEELAALQAQMELSEPWARALTAALARGAVAEAQAAWEVRLQLEDELYALGVEWGVLKVTDILGRMAYLHREHVDQVGHTSRVELTQRGAYYAVSLATAQRNNEDWKRSLARGLDPEASAQD
jgi:hypothetical protein